MATDNSSGPLGPTAQDIVAQLRKYHPSWLPDDNATGSTDSAAAATGDAIMTLIGKHESRGDPNAIGTPNWKPLQPPGQDLSSMNVRDVINWQNQPGSTLETVGPGPGDNSVNHPAVGLLQFKPKTLSGFATQTGLMDEPFTPDNQRKLGLAQMNSNGFTNYLNGNISDADFTKRMAKTWATIPMDESGLSRGGQKTQMTYQEWLNTIRAAKKAYLNGAGATGGDAP